MSHRERERVREMERKRWIGRARKGEREREGPHAGSQLNTFTDACTIFGHAAYTLRYVHVTYTQRRLARVIKRHK